MKPTTLLLAILMLCPPLFAQTKKQKALDLAVMASSEFDAGTTYTAMHSCSCREGDPMMRPFAGNPSVFAVSAFSAWMIDRGAKKLRVHHRKWAVVLQVGATAAHVVAGAHNLELQR